MAKTTTIFVSFETVKKPRNVDVFIAAWDPEGPAWEKEVMSSLKTDATQRTHMVKIYTDTALMHTTGKLIIFDGLNALAATEGSNLPSVLSAFISPTTSILATYHLDVPTSGHQSSNRTNVYAPSPLIVLKYIATTIFTTHSLHHVLACKAARDRSQVEPSFGLEEGVEGLVQGLGSNGNEGIVLEMEHRRKSGRGVREWYFLPLNPVPSTPAQTASAGIAREKVILLEDHEQYKPQHLPTDGEERKDESTFELGLTDKQRKDREGVVLPYFDAQHGGGEGGRILYDMGSEDDFDEEEDEI